MKWFGMSTAAAGVLLGLIALRMQTAIHNDASYQYGNYMPSSDTINIGLLQDQHLTFLAGCFLFIAGVVITCTGFVVEAQRDQSRTAAGLPLGVESAAAESYQLRARRPDSMTDAEKEASAKADRMIIIVGIALGVLALIAVFAFGAGTGPHGEQAAVVNNADALADQMMRDADNLTATTKP